MPEPPVRAGIYTRMSLVVMGDTTKVEDQARISREVCGHRGWEVAGTYTDNNKSAWQRDRKRPDWDRMLADVEAGKINAIVVYHGDRLIRQPWDLEMLLGLADSKGVRLASPTGTRDLDNPDDRFVLRIEAAQACRESDNTSRRKKAQHDRMRRSGLVRTGGRGGRAYGFAKDGVTQVPAEARVIRRMAERVLAGDGAAAIAAGLNAAGLATVTGGPWTHGTVRKMLARPRYAGLMPDGQQEAAWEPVLDRDTWEAACAMLSHRAAGYSRATNARRYLLSGIALCGSCGHPVAVRHSARGQSLLAYGCVNPGCRRKLHRSVRYLDAFTEGWVLTWLSSPELAELVREAPEPAIAAEIAVLERRRAEAEASLARLADHPGLSPEVTARAIASFDEKIARIRERITARPGRRLLAEYEGLSREQWKRLSLSTRRGLVAASCYITILPGRRGPGFDPDSVDIRPRE